MALLLLLAALNVAAAAPVLDFLPVQVPEGLAQHQAVASPALVYNGEIYATAYQAIIRSGVELPVFVPAAAPAAPADDAAGDAAAEPAAAGDMPMPPARRLPPAPAAAATTPFGLAVDQEGNGIYDTAEDGTQSKDLLISNEPDYVSYLVPEGTPDMTVYQITQFESPRPASVYITSLKHDPATCSLTPVATAPLDFSEWGGVWIPCAGQKTAWGTHLGGEEYEPDARAFAEAAKPEDISEDIVGYMRYFNVYPADVTAANLNMMKAKFNPYKYGYIFEVTVDGAGNAVGAKHMAMGRFSHELALVLPDGKTTYLTDDGDMVMHAVFVADEPNNLADGTLYAAKFTQVAAENGGDFTIEWVNLGHATQAELVDAVAAGTTFEDLFLAAAPVVTPKGMACPATADFTLINAGTYGAECLMVKEGMEVLASRFETRRYAAIMGATTEFSKWEGIAFDAATNKLHTAMSAVRRGMENMMDEGAPSTDYDIADPAGNHIQLPHNPCGCIYELPVQEVDGWMQATGMTATLCGVPAPAAAEGAAPPANACLTNGLSSPDNMVTAADQLIVAEDTTGHVNNMMWAMPIDTATAPMARVLTAPYGAEITGASWYENLNGCAYLFATIQHPYEDQPEMLAAAGNTGEAGWLGFIGPIRLPVAEDDGGEGGDVGGDGGDGGDGVDGGDGGDGGGEAGADAAAPASNGY